MIKTAPTKEDSVKGLIGFDVGQTNGEKARLISNEVKNPLIHSATKIRNESPEPPMEKDKVDNFEHDLSPPDLVPPWKSIIALCLAYLFTYSAFEAIQNLQSSINPENHVGVLSMAFTYSAVILGSALGPMCANLVGHKNIVLSCFVVHLCYTLSNCAPSSVRPAVLITMATFLGVCIGGLGMSRGVYITTISTSYCYYRKLPDSRLYSVMSFFYGIFYACMKGSQIPGNLMSSGILLSAKYNQSLVRDTKCGPRVCAEFDNTLSFERPPKDVLYLLFGAFALCNIVGILSIAFGIPNLSYVDKTSGQDETTVGIVKKNVYDCRSMLINPKFIAIMPLNVSQAIIAMALDTGYTKAFVTCAIGVQWVGYSMVALGVASSVTSILANFSVRCTGRIFQFCIGIGLDIATALIMLLWEPDVTSRPVMFLAVPFLAGIAQGILQPQLQTLIGSVFHKEELPSAYAAVNGVRCLAFALSLILACTACLYHILMLALVFYLPAVLGYAYTELREWRAAIKEDSGQ
ncbi:unc-93-like protein a [Plakobranchus ocellatus]|uniref:Unc-93-like protein a n=1 Tax=Plakobranchus ocellatus TaxID=259542 RepID=A0AAV4C5S6_9GAST|nr:unc-93-like protein a [Plakobranchus ocellatus]